MQSKKPLYYFSNPAPPFTIMRRLVEEKKGRRKGELKLYSRKMKIFNAYLIVSRGYITSDAAAAARPPAPISLKRKKSGSGLGSFAEG